MIVSSQKNQSLKFQYLGTYIGDVLWTADGAEMYAHISYLGMQTMEGWIHVRFGMFEDISYHIMLPMKKFKKSDINNAKRAKLYH